MVKGQGQQGQGRNARDVTALKIAIVASGRTMGEIAREAGVYENSLGRYARGTSHPRAEVAVQIAKALDTTVEELWPAKATA